MIDNAPQQIRTIIAMLEAQCIDATSEEMRESVRAALKAISIDAEMESAVVRHDSVEIAFSHPATKDRVWLATAMRLVSF